MQMTLIIAVVATEIIPPTEGSGIAKMTTAGDLTALDRTAMIIDEIVRTANIVTGIGKRMANILAPDVTDTMIETESTEAIDHPNVARHPRNVELAKLPNVPRN